MGISFVTTWVARQSQAHQTLLAAHVTAMNPQTQQATAQLQQRFLQAGADQLTASRQTLAALYGLLQQQAALLSYEGVFRLMGLLFLAVIPLVFLMQRAKVRVEPKKSRWGAGGEP
jgi:DHA2 family multidrug resistance protein